MSYDYTFDGFLRFTPNRLRLAAHHLHVEDLPVGATTDNATVRHTFDQMAALICDTFGTVFVPEANTTVTDDGADHLVTATVTLYGATQLGEEEQLLKTLAPYASGAVYGAGESGDHWVWMLSAGEFTEIAGEIVYPGMQDLDTVTPPV